MDLLISQKEHSILNAVMEHVVPVPKRSRRGAPCLSPHSTRENISPTELSDDIHSTANSGTSQSYPLPLLNLRTHTQLSFIMTADVQVQGAINVYHGSNGSKPRVTQHRRIRRIPPSYQLSHAFEPGSERAHPSLSTSVVEFGFK